QDSRDFVHHNFAACCIFRAYISTRTPGLRPARHDRNRATPPNRHEPNALRPRGPHTLVTCRVGVGRQVMAYTMIAERNNQKVRKQRESALIVLANAEVMQSEGWQVVIVDNDGSDFEPRAFEAS